MFKKHVIGIVYPLVFVAYIGFSVLGCACAATITMVKHSNQAIITIPNSVFVGEGSNVNPKYYQRLDNIVKYLSTRPNVRAVICGQFSLARQESLTVYFLMQGVEGRQFSFNKVSPQVNSKLKRLKPKKTIKIKKLKLKQVHNNTHKKILKPTKTIKLVKKDNTAEIYIPATTFAFDSYKIRPEYFSRLNAIAKYLQHHPLDKVKLFGYNCKLSKKCANAIAKYLIAKGVKKEMVQQYALTPIVREQNRRVNTIIHKDLSTPSPSYMPRVYLTGAGGYDDWTALGQGDILAPIFLRYDLNLFLYGQGRYSYERKTWADNPWTASLGLGYRQIVNDKVLLGAYVLGDYSHTALGHKNYVVSPGIEALGRIWEFRANGYIPLKNKEWQQSGWADQFGNYNYIEMQGHTRYDAIFTYYEETGPGGDAELGRKLFCIHNILVKGYINSYYYHMQHNDSILGAGAKITIEPSTYLKFAVAGSYDKHNRTVIMGSAELSLYDLFSSQDKTINNNDLQHKLFEPIGRNFGNIASGSDMRETGGPDDREAKPVIDVPPPNPSPNPGPNPNPNPNPNPDHHNYVEDDNAWYFGDLTNISNTGDKREVGDKGTAQNPYDNAEFNQDTLDYIKAYNKQHGYDHAELYFRPGTYHNFNDHVLVNKNFTFFGKENDFKAPAVGNDRALFVGGLSFANGNVTLQDIRLENDPNNPQTTAIDIGDANDVNINDVSIGDPKNQAENYTKGIAVDSGDNIGLKNTDIYTTKDNSVGINLNNVNSVVLNTDTVDAANGLNVNGVTNSVNIYKSNFIASQQNGVTGVNIANVGGDVTIKGIKVGSSASGGSFSDTGIAINGAHNIDIENGSHTVINPYDIYAKDGIKLKNINNAVIKKVTIEARNEGIYIYTANNVEIDGIPNNNYGYDIFSAMDGIFISDVSQEIAINDMDIVNYSSTAQSTGIKIQQSKADVTLAKDSVHLFDVGASLNILSGVVKIDNSEFSGDTMSGSSIGIDAKHVHGLFLDNVTIGSALYPEYKLGLNLGSTNVDISNSNIYASNSSGEADAIKSVGASTITINSGTIEADGVKAYGVNVAPNHEDYSTLNINGGSILSHGDESIAVYTKAVHVNINPSNSDVTIDSKYGDEKYSDILPNGYYAYGLRTISSIVNIYGDATNKLKISGSTGQAFSEHGQTVTAMGMYASDTSTTFGGSGQNITIEADAIYMATGKAIEFGGMSTVMGDILIGKINVIAYNQVLNDPNNLGVLYGVDLSGNVNKYNNGFQLDQYFNINTSGYPNAEKYHL